MADPRDVALGVAVAGTRTGLVAGRMMLRPARLVLRVPVLGGAVRGRADELAAGGARARAQARGALLESEALDRLICDLLEHPRTEQLVEHVLSSPGLTRLVVQVLESRLIDDLTEQVLRSPELERVVEYVATSPQVLDAVSRQTRSMADEVAVNVRRRAESADDAAERTVRGWLRRPRPQPT